MDPRSQDDVPAILLELQHIHGDETLRRRLFALLDKYILPGVDKTTGRPGMKWHVDNLCWQASTLPDRSMEIVEIVQGTEFDCKSRRVRISYGLDQRVIGVLEREAPCTALVCDVKSIAK